MPNLTCTIKEIKTHKPCLESYTKFVKEMKRREKWKGDETKVPLSEVLEICGIQDACWFLRCFDYKEYCLFCADVAESVLHIFENKYPMDTRPRKAIEEVKLYYFGYSSEKQVNAAASAADAAYAAAYEAAADATDAADAAYAAYTTDAAYAAYAAYTSAATERQWKITESLLIKFINL